MISRLATPQNRGFGFSYSTYGTPSSVSSIASTPAGLSSSLLGGGSIGRSLGKSFSTSNLRKTFDTDGESILSPGAFSAASSRFSGTGGMKKLTIDRSLRTDLFGNTAFAGLPSTDRTDSTRNPSNLKKKVSFDSNTVGGGQGMNGAGAANGSSVEDSSSTPTAQEQGYLRSSSRTNGPANGTRAAPEAPEMTQAQGNELAIVPEDESPASSTALVKKSQPLDHSDPTPGRYWMHPSLSDMKLLSKDRLRNFSGLTIGREGCGRCSFNEPVDLSNINLDHVFDNIAKIGIRTVTIYPQGVKKPPVGMGLNVASTITLENSWPRLRDRRTPSYEKSGPKFEKHVDRLRKVHGTEFVDYNKDAGEWIFRVPHFTTYSLNYEDYDEGSEMDGMQPSVLSDAPPTPTPKSRTPRARFTPMPSQSELASSMISKSDSQASSEPEDDTFQFKKGRSFPGAFDKASAAEDDQEMEVQQDGEPFLDQGSAVSHSDSGDEPSESNASDALEDRSVVIRDTEMDMAGSFPTFDPPPESFPKSILKTNRYDSQAGTTPRRPDLDLGEDWADQLQRTISPMKQDRQTLRKSQALFFNDHGGELQGIPESKKIVQQPGDILTSIDLMNSLFGKEEARRSAMKKRKQTGKSKGFEV